MTEEELESLRELVAHCEDCPVIVEGCAPRLLAELERVLRENLDLKDRIAALEYQVVDTDG